MISVVIPAYNEEENIGACLESLVRQTTLLPFEVIVADNGSTDGTRRIAETYGTRLHLRIVREDKRGRGAARAAGFREARGDILFSTDADAEVPADWIDRLCAALEADPGAVAATGHPIIMQNGAQVHRVVSLLWPFFTRVNSFVLRQPCLGGFSMAVRRGAYDAAGGFDGNTDAYEDLDLARRLHPYGRIVTVSGVRVRMSGRRFHRGIAAGVLDYLIPFVRKYVLRKKTAMLRNIRPAQSSA